MRKYKKEDIAAIILLEKNTLGTTLGEEYYLLDLVNPLANHFVIEEEGEVVGFISCIYDGEVVEMLNFCIHPQFQGKGIGGQLLIDTFHYFMPLGMKSYVLDVRKSNFRAIHLYEKLGFKTVHVRKNYYQGTEDALMMQRTFSSLDTIFNYVASQFAIKEEAGTYSKYTCLNHPLKRDLNYYDLIGVAYDSFLIQQIKDSNSSNAFLQIISDRFDKIVFDGFEMSETVLMYCNTFGYQTLKTQTNTVELLQNKDIAECENLLYLDSKEYGEKYASMNAAFLMEAYQNNKMSILVTKENNKIIGMLIVYHNQNFGFIENFFVLQEFQRQGYGSNLITAAISYLQERGVQDIYLEAVVDDTPIYMYEKMNFIRCKNYYYMVLEK